MCSLFLTPLSAHEVPLPLPYRPAAAVLVITFWSRLLAAAVAFGRLTGEVAMLTAEHLGRDVFAAAHEVNDKQTIVLHPTKRWVIIWWDQQSWIKCG